MTTTLTSGVDTLTPTAVNGYTATRYVQTVAHDIIGRPDPDVTYRPASSRSGTLELVFADEDAAASAETLLTDSRTWTLDSPTRPSIAMMFVVAGGSIDRTLDATRAAWLVRVPFREVLS